MIHTFAASLLSFTHDNHQIKPIIRPHDNNTKNEIQSEKIKKTYEELTKFFFKKVL